MKKLLTFILVFAMILSMVTGLSSCKKDEDDGGDKVIGGDTEVALTPSEVFRKRAETLVSELFPCEDKDNFIIKDANAFGLNAKVEAPSFLKDAINIGVEGSFAPEFETVIAIISGQYRSSDLKIRVEIDDKNDLFVTFPGVSEETIYGSLEEMDGDFSVEDLKDLTDKLTEFYSDMQEKSEELIDKYLTDDKVTVSEADVVVFGEEVKGVESVVYTLDRDDIIAICEDYEDFFNEFKEGLGDLVDDYDLDDFDDFDDFDDYDDYDDYDDFDMDFDTDFDPDEVPEDFKIVTSLFSKDGKVIRCEYAIAAEDEHFVMSADVKPGKKTEALFAMSFSDEDGTVAYIPVEYVYEKDGDEFEGYAELLLDKIILPDEDEDITEELQKLRADFSGTATKDEITADVNLTLGIEGSTIKLPLKMGVKRDGDRVLFHLSAEVNELNASATITGFYGKADVERGEYDKSTALDINDETIDDSDPRVQRLYSDLKAALADVIEDFPEVGEIFEIDPYDPDDPDEPDEPDDEPVGMIIYNDDYVNSIYLDGYGSGYFMDSLEATRKGDDYTITVGGDEYRFTLKKDVETVEIFGGEYEVTVEEEDGMTTIELSRDGGDDTIIMLFNGNELLSAQRNLAFEYELDGDELAVDLGGDELTFDFEIVDDDTVKIDGMEYNYEYEPRGYEEEDDVLFMLFAKDEDWTFYEDGTGSRYEVLEITNDGDVVTVTNGDLSFSVELDDTTKTVKLDGLEYEVDSYFANDDQRTFWLEHEEDGMPVRRYSILIDPDNGDMGNLTTYFDYEMDDDVITVDDHISKPVKLDYEIKGDYMILDDVIYEYEEN